MADQHGSTLPCVINCSKCGREHEKKPQLRVCPACRFAQIKAWRQSHKENVNSRNRQWYRDNKEVRAKAINVWQEKNRKKVLSYGSAYAKRNPLKMKVKNHLRRSRLAGTFSESDVHRLLTVQKGLCANPTCRKKIKGCYEVDHVMPIAKGGTNTADNLQLLCRPCNCKKQARDPFIWAQENGVLFA